MLNDEPTLHPAIQDAFLALTDSYELPPPDHYQTVAILCMLKCLGFSSTVAAAKALYGWGQDTSKCIMAVEQNYRLLEGMVLRRHLPLSYSFRPAFYLASGDREKLITEDFLSSCAPAWAEQIRAAIKTFSE